MKFRLGINYWPVSSAMYWWRRFDAEEVKRDFARIRVAGFDSVRVFLLWEDFQPAPDQIARDALARLVTVADVAANNKLSLVPTLFTGHMSGINWIPPWALEAGEPSSRFRVVSGGHVVRASLKNWYSDQSISSAQARLAREVAAVLGDHPALWAYDLGNENSNCVVPPSRECGLAWLQTVAGAIRSVDSSHPITMGLHMEDLEQDRKLGPGEAARVCDFLCMHGYPVYAKWAFSPTDAMLLLFLGLITRWLGGRDVLFEEFGAPTIPNQIGWSLQAVGASHVPLLDEEEAALFTHRALHALQRFGLCGAMLWCYGDYDQALWREPPLDEAVHERYFGLWRSDYSPKPALVEIERLAGIKRSNPPDDFAWIDINTEEYYLLPGEHLRHLYQMFRQRYQEEEREHFW
ncbi:MAG: glycoside hydrolase 5 family protein [Gammaproteobacteria bacterium]